MTNGDGNNGARSGKAKPRRPVGCRPGDPTVECPWKFCKRWLYTARLEKVGFKCQCGATFSRSLAGKPAPANQGQSNKKASAQALSPNSDKSSTKQSGGATSDAAGIKKLLDELSSILHGVTDSEKVQKKLSEAITNYQKASGTAPDKDLPPAQGLQLALNRQEEMRKKLDKATAQHDRAQQWLDTTTQQLKESAHEFVRAEQEVQAATKLVVLPPPPPPCASEGGPG